VSGWAQHSHSRHPGLDPGSRAISRVQRCTALDSGLRRNDDRERENTIFLLVIPSSRTPHVIQTPPHVIPDLIRDPELLAEFRDAQLWIPACAGMTLQGVTSFIGSRLNKFS